MDNSIDEQTNSNAPVRFLLKGSSCNAIFTTYDKAQYSYKTDCIAFPKRDKPFNDNDEIVIGIIGTQKQQEDTCESIYTDVCTNLKSESCTIKLLSPSKAVSNIKNKCYSDIDSEHFELHIKHFKNSEDCVLEFSSFEKMT